MRLLQVPRVHQVGHYITDRCRTKPLAASSRKHAGSHWLTCRDKGLDDGGQDFAFPVSDILTSRHILILPVLLHVPTYRKSTVTTWETVGYRTLVAPAGVAQYQRLSAT